MRSNKYDHEKIKIELKKDLSANRFLHTEGVMYTAAALAMAYGADIDAALTAGLLHDCAKGIPDEDKISVCEDCHLPVTAVEQRNPSLLHAKLGAYFAKVRFGVEEEEILDAITWHTTGKPDMTLLEKIVFIADYIEPGRDQAPRLSEIRQAAFRDIDRCMYLILSDTMEYLSRRPGSIDRMTQEAYDYYRELVNA